MTESARRAPERRPLPRGTYRLGTVAGIDVTVASSWFIVVGLLAVLMAPRMQQELPEIGAGAYLAGVVFAILLYGSILLHEISHALAARGFGMPVTVIHLHFLGGATEIEGEATTPWREFSIAVVGPLTSLAVGGVSLLVIQVIEGGVTGYVVEALAIANLAVGVLNLVPGLPLDGGRVLQSLVWAVTRRRSLGVVVAGWGGRLAAVLVMAYPFFLVTRGISPTIIQYVFAFLIASFLWAGATQALVTAKLRARLPTIQARRLARPAIGVPADLPLSEAIRRAQEAQAGSLVIVNGDGRPAGIVNEAAVVSTPDHRRPWLPTGDLARRLDDSLMLSADLVGEPLVNAMNRNPATEYVLVEADGSVYGVLVTKDVDDAFRTG
ncbi:MAG TPA: site-2 protease family protein [Nocardioidaceae bacterium]|nr:site-2 protease family protein [Nocardioidaceae bacterium]